MYLIHSKEQLKMNIGMENVQSEKSDKENSHKYVLKVQDKQIGFGYIFNREINPIEIYIDKEHQSNGYGKFLFNALVKEAKKQGIKGMIFELNETQYRFITIVLQAGAMQFGKNNDKVKLCLKLS